MRPLQMRAREESNLQPLGPQPSVLSVELRALNGTKPSGFFPTILRYHTYYIIDSARKLVVSNWKSVVILWIPEGSFW